MEQFFAAPREQVFAWFADHRNFGQLFPGRMRPLRPGPDGNPDGLGSVREIRIGLLRLEETITRFEPPACIEYRVTRGWSVRNHLGRLRFESVPGGTQLEYSLEFDSRLPVSGNLLAGLLSKSWRGGVQRAMESITGA